MAALEKVRRVLRPGRLVQRVIHPHIVHLEESVTAAHQGIADLQEEARALRERLDMTLRLAEAQLPRLDLLEDGLHQERRLNLRIAELTDIVTELVLPLHDREIDREKFDRLAPDTL